MITRFHIFENKEENQDFELANAIKNLFDFTGSKLEIVEKHTNNLRIIELKEKSFSFGISSILEIRRWIRDFFTKEPDNYITIEIHYNSKDEEFLEVIKFVKNIIDLDDKSVNIAIDKISELLKELTVENFKVFKEMKKYNL